MKLKNLISVADEEITIILNGITSDGREIGYDFEKGEWLDNSNITRSRLVKIKDMKYTRKYRGMYDRIIENFVCFKPKSIKGVEDFEMEFYRDIILKIKIYVDSSKSAIKEAIENRYKVIADARLEMSINEKIKNSKENKNKRKNKGKKKPKTIYSASPSKGNLLYSSTTSHYDVGLK